MTVRYSRASYAYLILGLGMSLSSMRSDLGLPRPMWVVFLGGGLTCFFLVAIACVAFLPAVIVTRRELQVRSLLVFRKKLEFGSIRRCAYDSRQRMFLVERADGRIDRSYVWIAPADLSPLATYLEGLGIPLDEIAG